MSPKQLFLFAISLSVILGSDFSLAQQHLPSDTNFTLVNLSEFISNLDEESPQQQSTMRVSLTAEEQSDSPTLVMIDAAPSKEQASVFLPTVEEVDDSLLYGKQKSIIEEQEEEMLSTVRARVNYAPRFAESYPSAHESKALFSDISVQSVSVMPASITAIPSIASEANSVYDLSEFETGNTLHFNVEEAATTTQAVTSASLSYSAPAVSSSVTSRSASVSGASGFSSGGSGGVSYSSSVEENTASPLASFFDFNVDGHVVITEEDEAGLVLLSTMFPGDFNLNIIGTEKTVDGVVQSPILDGAGLYHGFQIFFRTASTNEFNVNLQGVEAFINFANEGTSGTAGGAISLFNGGTIDFENTTSDYIEFNNNKVSSTGGHASGGAIFLTGGTSVSDLLAHFDGNIAEVEQQTSTTRYARGGAIFVGKLDSTVNGYSPTDEISSIGNISGEFTNNKAAFGGAIYMGENGKIGNIYSNFVDNTAEGYKQVSHSQGASGGAFRAWEGEIGGIHSHFTGNAAIAHTGMAVGGAVSLDGTKVSGGITGLYEGNIAYAATGTAQGGAYSLKRQNGTDEIIFTNTNFIGNIAATGLDNTATKNYTHGGALFIENSADVSIVADGEDVLISNNYVVDNATWDAATRTIKETDKSERDYTAFYIKDSTVTLKTTEGSANSITINDAIRDDNSTATTSEIIVEDNSTNEYGVKLNGEIGVDHLIVKSGGVELGTATHDDGSVTTGSFSNQSNLTIYTDAKVKTNADYLENVGDIDLQGTAELTLTGGTLLSDVNGGKFNSGDPLAARTGYIDIIGETTVGGASSFHAKQVNVSDTFILTESTSVNVETLVFSGYGKDDVNNGGNQIIADDTTTFAFNMIELNFATANPGDIFELIVAAEGQTIDIDFDYETIVFTVAGMELVEGEDFLVYERADGGVNVEILIKVDPPAVPEPSTALLSLVALGFSLTRRRRATTHRV